LEKEVPELAAAINGIITDAKVSFCGSLEFSLCSKL
jgi:hypothetical protein